MVAFAGGGAKDVTRRYANWSEALTHRLPPKSRDCEVRPCPNPQLALTLRYRSDVYRCFSQRSLVLFSRWFCSWNTERYVSKTLG